MAKCLVGIILAFFISTLLKSWIDYPWFLISIILVLSPEGKDAMELSLTRIKANLVGAGTGVVVLLSHIPTPWNIAAGAGLSLFICDQLKLNAGARSTLTAMIIILLHPEGAHLWDSALSRIIAVIAGSILGWLITYVFHSIFRINEPAMNSEAVKEEKEN
ncbi:MAG TPA: FUSC family protein [Cyclobacteriaceae bacterium]|nr:FUSC family protein [Cyclobacteriaceae bacterium]